MKKLLNTLYVQTQGMYLRREGETVVAEKDGEVKLRLPIHTLQGVVAFGNVMASPFLLGLCAERGVSVSFLTEAGRFLARVQGPVSGNVLLRLAQMRAYEDKAKKGDIARSFVIGKLMNARNVLLRRMRDHGDSAALSDAAAKIADVLRRVKDSAPDAERLRGLEGEAGAVYFGCFNELLVAQREAFSVESRNRREKPSLWHGRRNSRRSSRIRFSTKRCPWACCRIFRGCCWRVICAAILMHIRRFYSSEVPLC